ncbi:hypothetical protein HHK36_032490 [Tetracentron sinense]|uniref:Protein kinase domain-containing protein n=1 Tax=Tetracentron sinense TaxID=13715 RepID=A0A835CXM3_TETSI|nr:hypothetical protein HHK36_032490 [Tetracentron sinense]
MQETESDELGSVDREGSNDDGEAIKASENGLSGENLDDEPAFDVSGKTLELSLLDGSEDSVKGLYLYKNVFNLIPRSLGALKRLKTLKFFANEINLFPSESGNLVELECLQVKISSPGLSGIPLHNLKALKELELCKVPPRPSAFPILNEIAGLNCLTRLSVCHFSIRYLPPEIGCLNKLEYLDLSFNKLKSLPNEITSLNALKSLKVANNKLVELPSDLYCLQKLENLDLSNNRLKSLGSLKLMSMHSLQNLNLQYNKLLNCCQIPSWICCNLEGNGKDRSNDEFISALVEMDVFDAGIQEIDKSLPCKGSPNTSSSLLSEPSSSSRCSASRRMRKGWKRRDYFQQKARQEHLNNSRKWRGENHDKKMAMKGAVKRKQLPALASESLAEGASVIVVDLDDDDTQRLSGEADNILINNCEDDTINQSKGYFGENCSCVVVDSLGADNDCDYECREHDASPAFALNGISDHDEDSSSEACKNSPKSKRHSDRDLDNPKPSKFRRPVDDHPNLSCKYSNESLCSINDRILDGFYDAGRDRPFMPLQSYEQSFPLDSREVILVDRKRDEELDAIALSAQELVSRLKQAGSSSKERDQTVVDNLQIASLLALFVSDHFGGSDRSTIIERTRKAVSGSNYRKPFVCTCPTGNNDDNKTATKQIVDTLEDLVFIDLCEKSLRSIKAKRNSNIVPIGTLQFGVCRHRAVLMKYLCDHVEPPIPCELVRGYLDFLPHAWNVILFKRGNSWVRVIVDACRPHDIREETDQEYFCRYVPLSRINLPFTNENNVSPDCCFPSMSTCNEIEKAASSSLLRCEFGSVEAAAKVRTLEACGSSFEEMKNFEYTCLGEIRMLGALKKHSCIVEIYGHQIVSKWVPSVDGSKEHRLLQSMIVMEYIKGGPLKKYVEKLSEAGEKHVPVELALFIARDVACALLELHSKHIIHRDIKSENILIDLDSKRSDGTPIVKLCDFDRAIPLRSLVHTCCIAHLGIPPPEVCVGTPRWMAPEVLRAMHRRNIYGLEVDIWSYGCLLFELLTLQVPYAGLSETEIHNLLQTSRSMVSKR